MLTCPVLPIRDAVIFPGVITPLYTNRPQSVHAIMAASPSRLVLVVTQKNILPSNPTKADLYNFGTLCRVDNITQAPDGGINLVLEGYCRAKIVEYVYNSKFIEAQIEKVPTTCMSSVNETEALRRKALEELEHYVRIHPRIPRDMFQAAQNITNPESFADLVTSNLRLKLEIKQQLLEITEVSERLKRLIEILASEVELAMLERDIEGKVNENIKKNQREYFLREKLKAVENELGGDTNLSEAGELREKINSSLMPDNVKEVAYKQLERFEKMSPQSSETAVTRDYLGWLIDMPWGIFTEDDLDIENAQHILDEDHYGLEEVKDRIIEYLAVRKLAKQNMRAQILCFVGPPGVGKTSLGMSIARTMGRKFANIALGGLGDEAEIRGHRRTYVGALPGKIIQKIKQTGTSNPLLLLDEIDKIGSDYKGDPSSALLEVLDPEQNHLFTDNYLEVPFDLSKILFITTANTTSTIPAPLLDRMEIISLPGYLLEEKLEIAKKHLLPRILKEHGLTAEDMSISKTIMSTIIRGYTLEAGVRQLDRVLSKIARKIATAIAKNPNAERTKTVISNEKLKEMLGAPKPYLTRVPKSNIVGTSIGLAWTAAGGEVLLIESAVMDGSGQITFTGNLGNIMQESVKNSMAYIRSNAKKFGLKNFNWQKKDVHVHVPESAVPKDGPSAGITLALSICSSLTGRKIDVSYAMTGEMTLHGEVLPIGGVREKMLAAKRLGIKKLIIPADNKNDVDELKDWMKDDIEIHYVRNFDEVAALALKK